MTASSITRDSNGFPTGTVPAAATLVRSIGNTYALAPGTSLDGDGTTGCGASTINNVDSLATYWHPQPGGPKLDTVLSSQVDDLALPRARSEFTYDNNLITANLKTKRDWDSTLGIYGTPLTSTNSTLTQYGYYAFGNLTSVINPNGNTTSYTINGCTASSGAAAYPGAITRGTLVSHFTWDCSSGQLSTQTDPNGIVAKRNYDNLGRTTLVQEAQSTANESQTKITYAASSTPAIGLTGAALPLTITSQRDLSGTASREMVTVEQFDQRGQVAAASRPDGSIVSHYSTLPVSADAASYEIVSNPHFTTGEATMGWTRTKKDRLGRVVEVARYEGAAAPAPWSTNTSVVGKVTTSYDGDNSTTTDEALKVRQQFIDGAGRLTKVVEDPGSSPHLAYSTKYTYDFKDDLLSVTQTGQSGPSRQFQYSSLGRLTSATNPESGLACYAYDGNGNLVTKKFAAGSLGSAPTSCTAASGLASVSMTYDALSRLKAKSYSGPTAAQTQAVTWTYDDPSVPNARGRQTAVTNGSSTTNIISYDELGRITGSRQTTGTQPPYLFGYLYNRAGLLTQETYPSSRTAKYNYDNGGRISSVSGTAPGSGVVIPYAGSATAPIAYAPHGPLLSMNRGDGLVETWTYNSRMTPASISVGTPGSPASVLGLSLYYCPSKVQSCSTNNGNLQIETLGALGVDQTFAYDAVNRLSTANEAGGSAWSQTYGYDAFGNRWVVIPGSYLPNSSFTPTGSATSSSNFTSPTNQVALNANAFDFAGNQTAIGGYAFQYDAENHQIEANFSNGTSNPVSSNGYIYDGEGRRVQKITCPAGTSLCTPSVAGATVINYVYDAFDDLAAEYTVSGTLPTPACTRCYLSVDHLGSTRALTDGTNGSVVERHDYLPFGEELYAGTGGRTTTQGYISGLDAIKTRHRFTGKERDSETSLDFFGARYFSGAQGRWTSPDLINVTKARLMSPANTLNKYVYAANNPLKYVDPNGQDITVFYRRGNMANPADSGHAFAAVLNQSTGQVAFMSFAPKSGAVPFGAGAYNAHLSPDYLRQHASLTIQTTPELAQKAIEEINRRLQNPGSYNLFTNNCTTECESLLRLLDIATTDGIHPDELWTQLYRNYSAEAEDHGQFGVPSVRYQPGTEFGQPRFSGPGFDYQQFLWQLYTNQAQREPKGCVTVQGPNGPEEECH